MFLFLETNELEVEQSKLNWVGSEEGCSDLYLLRLTTILWKVRESLPSSTCSLYNAGKYQLGGQRSNVFFVKDVLVLEKGKKGLTT